MELSLDEFRLINEQSNEMSMKIGNLEASLQNANAAVSALKAENEELRRKNAESEMLIKELTKEKKTQNVNINILNVIMSNGIIPLSAQILDANFHKMPWGAQMTSRWVINESLWSEMPPELNKLVDQATMVDDYKQQQVQNNNFMDGSNPVINTDITMTGNDAVYNENNNGNNK